MPESHETIPEPKIFPGSPTKPTPRELIAERGKTHGDYTLHAEITQAIKRVMYERSTKTLTAPQLESLDMIAHKIGRILAGDPDFRDHWADIAGYAQLVADRCSK